MISMNIKKAIEAENKKIIKAFLDLLKKDLIKMLIPCDRVISEKDIWVFLNRKKITMANKAYKVAAIDVRTEKIVKTFPSIRAAARELKINDTLIRKCLKGELKTTASFKWKRI